MEESTPAPFPPALLKEDHSFTNLTLSHTLRDASPPVKTSQVEQRFGVSSGLPEGTKVDPMQNAPVVSSPSNTSSSLSWAALQVENAMLRSKCLEWEKKYDGLSKKIFYQEAVAKEDRQRLEGELQWWKRKCQALAQRLASEVLYGMGHPPFLDTGASAFFGVSSACAPSSSSSSSSSFRFLGKKNQGPEEMRDGEADESGHHRTQEDRDSEVVSPERVARAHLEDAIPGGHTLLGRMHRSDRSLPGGNAKEGASGNGKRDPASLTGGGWSVQTDGALHPVLHTDDKASCDAVWRHEEGVSCAAPPLSRWKPSRWPSACFLDRKNLTTKRNVEKGVLGEAGAMGVSTGWRADAIISLLLHSQKEERLFALNILEGMLKDLGLPEQEVAPSSPRPRGDNAEGESWHLDGLTSGAQGRVACPSSTCAVVGSHTTGHAIAAAIDTSRSRLCALLSRVSLGMRLAAARWTQRLGYWAEEVEKHVSALNEVEETLVEGPLRVLYEECLATPPPNRTASSVGITRSAPMKRENAERETIKEERHTIPRFSAYTIHPCTIRTSQQVSMPDFRRHGLAEPSSTSSARGDAVGEIGDPLSFTGERQSLSRFPSSSTLLFSFRQSLRSTLHNGEPRRTDVHCRSGKEEGTSVASEAVLSSFSSPGVSVPRSSSFSSMHWCTDVLKACVFGIREVKEQLTTFHYTLTEQPCLLDCSTTTRNRRDKKSKKRHSSGFAYSSSSSRPSSSASSPNPSTGARHTTPHPVYPSSASTSSSATFMHSPTPLLTRLSVELMALEQRSVALQEKTVRRLERDDVIRWHLVTDLQHEMRQLRCENAELWRRIFQVENETRREGAKERQGSGSRMSSPCEGREHRRTSSCSGSSRWDGQRNRSGGTTTVRSDTTLEGTVSRDSEAPYTARPPLSASKDSMDTKVDSEGKRIGSEIGWDEVRRPPHGEQHHRYPLNAAVDVSDKHRPRGTPSPPQRCPHGRRRTPASGKKREARDETKRKRRNHNASLQRRPRRTREGPPPPPPPPSAFPPQKSPSESRAENPPLPTPITPVSRPLSMQAAQLTPPSSHHRSSTLASSTSSFSTPTGTSACPSCEKEEEDSSWCSSSLPEKRSPSLPPSPVSAAERRGWRKRGVWEKKPRLYMGYPMRVGRSKNTHETKGNTTSTRLPLPPPLSASSSLDRLPFQGQPLANTSFQMTSSTGTSQEEGHAEEGKEKKSPQEDPPSIKAVDRERPSLAASCRLATPGVSLALAGDHVREEDNTRWSHIQDEVRASHPVTTVRGPTRLPTPVFVMMPSPSLSSSLLTNMSYDVNALAYEMECKRRSVSGKRDGWMGEGQKSGMGSTLGAASKRHSVVLEEKHFVLPSSTKTIKEITFALPSTKGNEETQDAGERIRSTSFGTYRRVPLLSPSPTLGF